MDSRCCWNNTNPFYFPKRNSWELVLFTGKPDKTGLSWPENCQLFQQDLDPNFSASDPTYLPVALVTPKENSALLVILFEQRNICTNFKMK